MGIGGRPAWAAPELRSAAGMRHSVRIGRIENRFETQDQCPKSIDFEEREPSRCREVLPITDRNMQDFAGGNP